MGMGGAKLFRGSIRAKRDEQLMADAQRLWHANCQAYGADKVLLQMNSERQHPMHPGN